MRPVNAFLGSVLVLAAAFLPASAAAQEGPPGPPLAAEPAAVGPFSANLGFTSEYYFRGITQTNDAPAIQGGLDYEVSLSEPVALYLGAWGSNVAFNERGALDGATIEIDGYGGLRGTFGKTRTSWDVGFIYYAYPGDDPSLDYDFLEFQTALGRDFGAAAITASVNYSSDNFGASGRGVYPKLKLAVPVPAVKRLSLSGHVAKQFIEKEDAFGAPDYLEWNISATVNGAGFNFTVAYSDTDLVGPKPAFLLSVARSF